jgi:hypothetical protein
MAGDILHARDGTFVEYWDVIQDKALRESSTSGLPMSATTLVTEPSILPVLRLHPKCGVADRVHLHRRPEIDKGKVISFPNLFQKKEGIVGGNQQPLVNQ